MREEIREESWGLAETTRNDVKDAAEGESVASFMKYGESK